jgi:hypothetical protein
MRTIPYRNILWAVAYKIRVNPADPNIDFLTNQASAMTDSANEWVRRLWDSKDWPEWTFTEPRNPVAHIVPYETNGTTPASPLHPIGTVRKVFLADPSITPGRELDTHFEYTAQGIHCGFEHGPTVWMKFLPPCPQYSSELWRAENTYRRNRLVYSQASGETYKSKSNGNSGHDPTFEPTPLLTQITQSFVPAVPPPAAINEKWRFTIDPLLLSLRPGGTYKITLLVVTSPGGPVSSHTFQYTALAGATVDQVLNGLIAAAAGSGDTWVSSLIVTKDTPNNYLLVEKDSSFSNDWNNSYVYWGVVTHNLAASEVQIYQPEGAGSPAIPQIGLVTLPNPLIASGLYKITMIDSANGVHSIQYESEPTDGVTEILNGLISNFNASTDPWFASVLLVPNFTYGTLTISIFELASINAEVESPISPWWELIPFPFDLAEQVIRGVYADMLKQFGQTDKGIAEEGVVPTEQAARLSSITTGSDEDELTTQQLTKPRYQP